MLYLEASKKKVQITDNFLDGVFLGIKEGSEEFIMFPTSWLLWCAELSKDGLVKTLQILSSSTGSVEHPGYYCQFTSREIPRESREQPLRIDVRLVHADSCSSNQHGTNQATSSVQQKFSPSWPDMGTLLGVLAVKQR